MNVVKFAYYDEFQCTGPECPDSCCKDWHIRINKKEYLDYKKMKCSPELRSVIDTAFKRNKNGEDYSYAEMRLKENGDCPFLGEDSLCRLQKELGEKVLSFTCSTFPRLVARVGMDTIRQSCSATCCHVTEILMRHPEGLQIIEEEYDGKNKWINKELYNYLILKSWEGFPYYWNIVNAEIDILQNRSFTIPERMLILGYFCQKADDNIKIGTPEKIPALAEMLLDNELCGKIASALKPSSSDDRISTNSVEILSNMHIRIQTTDEEHLKKAFLQVTDYISYELKEENGRTSVSFSRTEYDRLTDSFRAIENERPYIIENLLVNIIFQSDPQIGVWKNFFELAVFYNTLKICAPAFLTENYTDKELAAALTKAVKMVINTHLAESGTFEDFIRGNMNTLPYAAFLVC